MDGPPTEVTKNFGAGVLVAVRFGGTVEEVRDGRESGSRVQLFHLRPPTELDFPRLVKESPVVLPAKSLGSRGLLPESRQKDSLPIQWGYNRCFLSLHGFLVPSFLLL